MKRHLLFIGLFIFGLESFLFATTSDTPATKNSDSTENTANASDVKVDSSVDNTAPATDNATSSDNNSTDVKVDSSTENAPKQTHSGPTAEQLKAREEEKRKFEEHQKQVAAELKIKKLELESNQDDIEKTQQVIDINLQQQDLINAEIDQLDLQIITLEEEIKLLDEESRLKKLDIEITKTELAQAEIDKQLHYEATKNRMVRMYKNNRYGYIYLLFSSSSLIELLNRSYYISIIADIDRTVLAELKEKQNLVAAKKLQLDSEYEALELLKDSELNKIADLSTTMGSKMTKIAQLEESQSSLEDQLGALEIISTELTEEIQSLIAQSQLAFNGALFVWPVPGWTRISSDYNPRQNPILNIPEFHQGIDIPAAYGSPVVAAADGVVIIAGWVNGFGYTVMIDHGDGLTTLYGHNSTLNVNVGDYVYAGQKIAGIGSTGYSTGNHSHFEVRVHGQHTNPWPYLGGKR